MPTDPTAQRAILRALRDAATDPAQRSALDAAIAALAAGAAWRRDQPGAAGGAGVGVRLGGRAHGADTSLEIGR
jgi:hypothetical protein